MPNRKYPYVLRMPYPNHASNGIIKFYALDDRYPRQVPCTAAIKGNTIWEIALLKEFLLSASSQHVWEPSGFPRQGPLAITFPTRRQENRLCIFPESAIAAPPPICVQKKAVVHRSFVPTRMFSSGGNIRNTAHLWFQSLWRQKLL
eukprot:Gb_08769 [translate_table: standard]